MVDLLCTAIERNRFIAADLRSAADSYYRYPYGLAQNSTYGLADSRARDLGCCLPCEHPKKFGNENG